MSKPLDEIRSILRSGQSDAEIVGAIRLAVGPRPAPQPELQRDRRNWPILNSGSAWDRRDDPEIP